MDGSSSDSDLMDEEQIKKEKIKELVQKIQMERAKKANKIKGKLSKPVKKKSVNTSAGCSGRGKHTVYKLYIGWQHYSNDRYKVVTVKKGGGTRMLEYNVTEDMSVETIIERGAKFFFLQGKSQFGGLEDMDVSLGSFMGENLEKFVDLEGNDCSFQQYLKSHGLFSSQFHLYIKTKKKQLQDSTSSVPALKKKVLLVNNEVPGNIEMKYKKTTMSRYDKSESTILCHSLRQCYNSATQEVEYEDYHCASDGFLVESIKKNNTVYLTVTEDGYQIYSSTSSQNPELIMFGPDEIYGLNDGDLLLGLISPLHNKNVLYKWFKDGQLVFSGQNACIFKVSSPGNYCAGIYWNEQLYTYDVQCSVTEPIHANQTEKLHLHGSPSQEQSTTLCKSPISPSDDFTNQSQKFMIQSHDFTSHLQTCHQTITSQEKAFTILPHNFEPQTPSIQLYHTTSQPQLFTTQSHDITSQLQTCTTQSYHTTSQPHTLTTRSHDITSQLQTFTTQSYHTTSQPPIITTQSHEITSQLQTCTTQSHDITSKPQPCTSHSYDITSQPHTFTTQLHDISFQLQTCTTQSLDITSQPQTCTTQSNDITSQLCDITSQPQTCTTQSYYITSQLRDITSQLQTCITQSHDISSQPQTCTSQLNDITSQLQTGTTQSYDITSQSQICTTQSHDITSQPQTCTTQSHDITSQLQTCTTQSHDITSQLQTCTTQSYDITSQSQDIASQTQTCTTHSHNITSQLQICTTQSHDITCQLQTCTTQSYDITSQPHTFTSHLHDISSQLQTCTTQSYDITSKPQTCTTQSHDITCQPPIITTQSHDITSQPHTFTTHSHDITFQPQSFTTRSHDIITELQSHDSMTQLQAFSTQAHEEGFTSTQSDSKTQPNASPAQLQSCTSTTRKKKSEPSIQKVEVTDLDIISKIGQGGFGEVYQGEWLETKVAIKKVQVKRMRLVKNSVLQEVNVHSEIRHPNIVLLMAYALDCDHLFLISECVMGYNLDEVLFGGKISVGALTPSVKLSVAQKISQAISYLHNRLPLIIHRDIKPENVLVSPDLTIVKLCDMGLARLQSLNTMVTTMGDRKGVQQAGTPMYQAPEIILHNKKANKETDVWSLACTLAELYSEAAIWVLECTSTNNSVVGEDCDDSVECLRIFMKTKTMPHGVEHLSILPIASSLISIILKGLDYNAKVRPSALQIARAFKE